MSDTIGTTAMLSMRAMPFMLMMFVSTGAIVRALTGFHIVLQTKNLLMMMMR